MIIFRKKKSHDVTKSGKKNSKGPGNSDFKSGLAVISGVIKLGRISIAKAYNNLGRTV